MRVDITDSPYTAEDFIWRGPAEEIKKLLLIRAGESSWIANCEVRGIPASYIRIFSPGYGGSDISGTVRDAPNVGIKTTILFIEDWVEISHQTQIDPPKFVSEEFELTDPKSLDTMISWLKSHNLVSESTQLGDAA
jgi:hypothetical protein